MSEAWCGANSNIGDACHQGELRRAETEVILADYVRKIAKGTCSDGVGVSCISGSMDPERTILRPNFDTLYSFAVLDLESPATVVLP